MDPDRHYGFDVPAWIFRGEKEAVEQILQTVFAKANGELAKLSCKTCARSQLPARLGTAQNGSAQ